MKKLDPKKVERMVEMAGQGMSLVEIGNVMGISKLTVGKYVRKVKGIAPKRRKAKVEAPAETPVVVAALVSDQDEFLTALDSLRVKYQAAIETVKGQAKKEYAESIRNFLT